MILFFWGLPEHNFTRGQWRKWSGIYRAPLSPLCPLSVVKIQQDILPEKNPSPKIHNPPKRCSSFCYSQEMHLITVSVHPLHQNLRRDRLRWVLLLVYSDIILLEWRQIIILIQLVRSGLMKRFVFPLWR